MTPVLGLVLAISSSFGPSYYVRAVDPVLGPCHVTDDRVQQGWSGTLAPGQSWTHTEWFCGPTDESVLPGHLDEGSDEDTGFTVTAKNPLEVSLTLLTPDNGLAALPVRTTPGRSFTANACAYSAQRVRYTDNVAWYQRGYVTISVSNPSSHTVRDITVYENIGLAGDPLVLAHCP